MIGTIGYTLFVIVQIVIGFNLVFPLILYALYQLRVKVANPAKHGIKNPSIASDYALIVTAYEQTDQLPEVIGSLLQLNYPRYHIYVVADKCDLSTIPISHPKVLLLRPEEVLASNTKSHFYAIERFVRTHDRLVIIDSDNTVDPNLLHELDVYFDQGYKAVQGVREAKNLDTDIARLDSARDIYYHFYDGKVLFGAGSSATLAGSGMAFTVALYKECLGKLTIEGAGFDKVLQAEILKRKHRIAFAPAAIVYDEKTKGSQQLVGQRARWINTWFRYFTFGFELLGRSLVRPDWNQFLFGLVLLRPPLFIFLLLSVGLGIINLFIAPSIALLWLVGLGLFTFGFVWALLCSNTSGSIFLTLYKIPRFVFFQVLALLKVRKANKISVATRHGDPDSTRG